MIYLCKCGAVFSKRNIFLKHRKKYKHPYLKYGYKIRLTNAEGKALVNELIKNGVRFYYL